MIIETFLSLHLMQAPPQLPFAAVSRSSSYSRSYSRSYSPRPSSSSPTRIRASAPANTIRVKPPSSTKTVPTQPKVLRSSSGNVVINKQKAYTAPPITPSSATPKPASTAPVRTYEPRPQIVRETYVERDSGIFGNPFFWLWMSDNNRSSQPPVVVQSPAPAVSQTTLEGANGEQVKTITQTVVKQDEHRFLREFATFSLGSGLTILVLSRLSR